MATQNFKRDLLLNLYREGKKISLVCFLLPIKRDKMSDTCRLFPPFGDLWPFYLLLSVILSFPPFLLGELYCLEKRGIVLVP